MTIRGLAGDNSSDKKHDGTMANNSISNGSLLVAEIAGEIGKEFGIAIGWLLCGERDRGVSRQQT